MTWTVPCFIRLIEGARTAEMRTYDIDDVQFILFIAVDPIRMIVDHDDLSLIDHRIFIIRVFEFAFDELISDRCVFFNKI